LSNHIILFLAANPLGTMELALGREARSAVRPLDLLGELRQPQADDRALQQVW